MTCLAVLYRLAASNEKDAQLPSTSSPKRDGSITDDTTYVTASWKAVADSLWNVVLLKQVLGRMIQQSVMLTGLSTAVEDGSRGRSTTAPRWCWWLVDEEAQQICQPSALRHYCC